MRFYARKSKDSQNYKQKERAFVCEQKTNASESPNQSMP
ncbi:hypothetical protein GVAMD_1089 [Gardnerella vaginalis AMD]|nr:hypothetical protein GVAMD_1089 [Gardnerella vaginalis AMD]